MKLSLRVLYCLVILSGVLAFAQTRGARLEGTVQDPTGAVVPNATISALNLNTQVKAEEKSNAEGGFVFPALQPGTYSLTVDAAGFRKTLVKNIELSVGDKVAQNIRMELGQTSESVTVEANALTVQTTDSQISSAVLLKDITTLPQLNRTPITIAIFQPGVQIDIRAGQDASFSHVNGLRQGSNNSTLDGIDVNDSVAPRLGLSMTANSSDSVGEFRVVTSAGSSEFGRSAGAQVSLVTNAGTNQFHGNAYDYLRNTVLNANDFFNNQSGGAVPKLIKNIYGGSFGGPIKHNKTFIFGNVQSTRTRAETVRNRTVPSLLARQGIFQWAANGTQQFNFAKADPRGIGIDPGVAKIFALYPAPNNVDVGDGLNSVGFRFNNPTPSYEDQFTIRGDHHLTQNQTVFLRWSWQRNYSVDNLNNADATFPGQVSGAQGGHRWGYATGWDWTISPTLFNEARFGHQSATAAFYRDNRPNGPAYATNLFTDVQFNGFAQGRVSPVEDITDSITKVLTRHTLKGGFSFRRTKQHGYNFAGVYPNVTTAVANGNTVAGSFGPQGLTSTQRTTFESLYNDVLGRVDQVVATFYSDLTKFQPLGNPRVRDFVLLEGGGFAQDDWRVNSRLTLNLGLRWEYFAPPAEQNSLQGVLDKAALINGGAPLTDITVTKSTKWFGADRNNIAPRIGFAYDATGDGKTAIRGNYGIYFDRAVGATVGTIDGNTPGFSQSVPSFPNQNNNDIRFSESYALPVAPTAPVLTLPVTRSTSVVLASPNLRTGYVQSYGLNVQRQLSQDMILQVGYVGNRGVKLFMDRDLNQPQIYSNGFLTDFVQMQGFVNNATPVPSGNVFVKLFGSAPAAVTALATTNFKNGNVGTVLNTLDRTASNYNRFAAAGLPSSYFRLYPQFNQVITATNDGRSYYDSLQVSVRRTRGNLRMSVNYTWSKSMDNISGEGNGFSTPIDNYNIRLNKARADFDRPQSLNLTSTYTLPFGKGQAFGRNWNRVMDSVFGGWELGNLYILQSGQPFSVSSQRSTIAVSGVGNGYANYAGTDRSIGVVERQGSGVFFFSPNQIALFSAPAAGQVGNSGRNQFNNPFFTELDSSLVKRFKITERHAVTFRAEAYNIFNHPNFGLAAANLNINNPASFGKFSSTLGTQVGGSSARSLQLALRYDF